jgi:hypothetical protein
LGVWVEDGNYGFIASSETLERDWCDLHKYQRTWRLAEALHQKRGAYKARTFIFIFIALHIIALKREEKKSINDHNRRYPVVSKGPRHISGAV